MIREPSAANPVAGREFRDSPEDESPRLDWSFAPVLLASLIFLCFFVKFLFNGFDVTDESYYLLNISNPWRFDNTSSQFALLYHLLFKICAENIAILRIANFALVFAANYVLSLFFVKIAFDDLPKSSPGFRRLLSFQIAFVSLLFYALWIPTPSYNSLNHAGLSVTALGLLLVRHFNEKGTAKLAATLPAWFMTGLGGYLVFVAKPQSAVLIALLAIFFLLAFRVFSLKGVAAAAGLSFLLLLAHSLVLDGDPMTFVNRYRKALEVENITKVHDSFIFFDFNTDFIKTLINFQYFKIPLLLILLTSLMTILFRETKLRNHFLIFFALLSAWVTALCFFVGFDPYPPSKGPWLWIIPPTAAIIDFILSKRGFARFFDGKFIFAVFFVGLSFAYSAGTNNDIIITLTLSSFFVFLGLLSLLDKNSPNLVRNLMTVTALSSFLVMSLLVSAWFHPYRSLSPLWTADTPIRIPIDGKTLRLPDYQAQAVADLYSLSERAEFPPDAPLIDLTGRFPGFSYLIKAHLPNVSWLGSGYRGSLEAAVIALSDISCEDLARAWVIHDNQPLNYHFPPEILEAASLDYRDHYRKVGEFAYPVGVVGGSLVFRVYSMLKPHDGWRDEIAPCEAKREAGGN
jgi:hypothetical protein